MEILETKGNPDLAEVFIAQLRADPRSIVEFVDAIDPRYPREEKSVCTVSTQFGCPVSCLMCDSGDFFAGNLTAEEIFSEIDFVVGRRWPDRRIDSRKFKIHFARMGEPALNPAVLDVLEQLPERYEVPGLIPCIPTIAPASAADWFERMLEIKKRLYMDGHFQLQLSINSTDPKIRDWLMPVKKWDLPELARYGSRFFDPGDRKVVLNFALARGLPVDHLVIREYFNPERFMIKVTPVNPTDIAVGNVFETIISAAHPDAADELVEKLGELGFDCVVSIGDEEEIAIGSNCGQAAARLLRARRAGESVA